MIHSATWECDESRPARRDRQRPSVVSLSQRYLVARLLNESLRRATLLAPALSCSLGAACAGRVPATFPAPSPAPDSEAVSSSPALPRDAEGGGPLALHVVYPPPDAVLQIRDSSFLFGTAGRGDAAVTIDGQPARVWPNGAWLAYVALPADSVMQLRIDARARCGLDVAGLSRAPGLVPDAGRVTAGAVWVDSLSLAPSGRLWLGRGEYLTLNRASQ